MGYEAIKRAAQKRSNELGTHYRLYSDSMGWAVCAIPRESLRFGGDLEVGDELISPERCVWAGVS
jgi:hypothetical protein